MKQYKQTITKIVLSIAQVHPAQGNPANWHLLQDLRLSPLKLLEICLRLEKEFKLKIDDAKYFQAQCVEDIEVIIAELWETRRASG